MTAGQVSDYTGAAALLDSMPDAEWLIGLAPVSPDTQAVAVWAAMNSRGERILSPECGWLSL